MKHCHACGAEVEILDRVGRRDACERCGADLHCCKNCRHHDPFAQNQCREPAADVVIRDREAGNFCDHFAFRDGRPERDPVEDAKAKLEALFRK
jgi:hypothetical protein